MSKFIDKTEYIRDSCLRFLTSEITFHGSVLVGFSVILFAYLDVVSKYFPRILLRQPFCLTIPSLQYLAVFVIFWIITAAIIFTLMRLVIYGKLSYQVITYDKPVTSFLSLWNETTKEVQKKKFLGTIQLKYFIQGIEKFSKGFWLSLAIGGVISVVLIFTFFFTWV